MAPLLWVFIMFGSEFLPLFLLDSVSPCFFVFPTFWERILTPQISLLHCFFYFSEDLNSN